ncbi:MAG: hypothetical protein HOP17_17335 [Acidobacteria bacterium]|nr:hypothetical protein [Acidobacteriota bacterium]
MRPRKAATLAVALLVFSVAGCKSSSGLIGPTDETADAAALIVEANKDLRVIKVVYEKNQGKRDQLIEAMRSDNAAEVKRLSGEVVDAINDGTVAGKNALDKIDQARDLNVNEDYAEYLRLKWEALNKQLEAFEEYRQAARKLRDNYDPKNAQAHAVVAADFESRSENFQKLMEKARDYSSQANELAKDVLRRPAE